MLVVPLEIVAIEQRQWFTVGVADFKYADIRFIDRDVLAFLEGNAVQLVGRKKDAVFQHVVHLEIRLDLSVIEIVFCLADLIPIEIPVPRLQGKAGLLRIDHRLNVLRFALGLASRHRHQRVHELQRGFRSLGHLVFEFPRRVAGKAQQPRALGAQLRDAGDNVARVVGIAAFRTVPGIAENGLARRANAQRREHRLLRGVL